MLTIATAGEGDAGLCWRDASPVTHARLIPATPVNQYWLINGLGWRLTIVVEGRQNQHTFVNVNYCG